MKTAGRDKTSVSQERGERITPGVRKCLVYLVPFSYLILQIKHFEDINNCRNNREVRFWYQNKESIF